MFELHKTHTQNSLLKDAQSTSTVTIPYVTAQEAKRINAKNATSPIVQTTHTLAAGIVLAARRGESRCSVQKQTVKKAHGVKCAPPPQTEDLRQGQCATGLGVGGTG